MSSVLLLLLLVLFSTVIVFLLLFAKLEVATGLKPNLRRALAELSLYSYCSRTVVVFVAAAEDRMLPD